MRNKKIPNTTAFWSLFGHCTGNARYVPTRFQGCREKLPHGDAHFPRRYCICFGCGCGVFFDMQDAAWAKKNIRIKGRKEGTGGGLKQDEYGSYYCSLLW